MQVSDWCIKKKQSWEQNSFMRYARIYIHKHNIDRIKEREKELYLDMYQ